MGCKVLKTLPNNRAIVSTRGRRRIVLMPGGEVLADMLTIGGAKAFAKTFNGCLNPVIDGKRAVIEKY